MMKKRTLPWVIAVSIMAAPFLPSCVNDQLPEPALPESCMDSIPTYEGSIKAIIDNTCAYSGCHLDGSAPGVYANYEGLRIVLESGRFRERVIGLRGDPNQGMPPSFAPDGRPRELTQMELELIQCWLENDFPEK